MRERRGFPFCRLMAIDAVARKLSTLVIRLLHGSVIFFMTSEAFRRRSFISRRVALIALQRVMRGRLHELDDRVHETSFPSCS